MKYYGKGQVWLKVRMQGALVCLERPRGSDVQALLDRCPDMRRALSLVSHAQRAGVPQEVSLTVAADEVRDVCAFLASRTLSVEGLDWSAIPDDERACVWDEQPAADVMRAFGIVLSAHAVPGAVDKINLIAERPAAPVVSEPSQDAPPIH